MMLKPFGFFIDFWLAIIMLSMRTFEESMVVQSVHWSVTVQLYSMPAELAGQLTTTTESLWWVGWGGSWGKNVV